MMKKILALTAASLLLSACQPNAPANSQFAPVDPAQHEVWQLVEGQAGGKMLNLQAHNMPITLIFSREGVSGQSPINRYQAAADTGGGKLVLRDHIMTTKMAADRPAMHLESDYLQALRSANSWQREGNQLVVRGEGITLRYMLQGQP